MLSELEALVKSVDVEDTPLVAVGHVLVSPGRARAATGELPLLWVDGDRAVVEVDGELRQSQVAGFLEVLAPPRACGRTRVQASDALPASAHPDQLQLLEGLDLRQSALTPAAPDGSCWLQAPRAHVSVSCPDAAVYCAVARELGVLGVATAAAFTNPSTGAESVALLFPGGSVAKAPRPEAVRQLDRLLGVMPRPWMEWCAGGVWLPPRHLLEAPPQLGDRDPRQVRDLLLRLGVAPTRLQEVGFA